jgi:hypothetical protein
MTRRHLARLGLQFGLVLGVALTAGGTALLALPAGRVPPDAGEVAVRSVQSPAASPQPVTPLPADAPAVEAPAAPELPFTPPPLRLELPDVELSAPIIPVSVDGDGELGIPDDPQLLGWWASGPAPTQPAGNVVVVGHVDSAEFGRGLFARLPEVPMGAVATVVTSDGARHDYAIEARRTYPRYELPPEIFDRAGSRGLVLITCTGPYDRSHRTYRATLVLWAVPAASAR